MTAQSAPNIEINRYDIPVEIILDEYETFDELEADVVETVANTILTHVDEYTRDDDEAYERITQRVTFDDERVSDALEDNDADALRIETMTQLGIATGDGV
jgi:hypothetical protein